MTSHASRSSGSSAMRDRARSRDALVIGTGEGGEAEAGEAEAGSSGASAGASAGAGGRGHLVRGRGHLVRGRGGVVVGRAGVGGIERGRFRAFAGGGVRRRDRRGVRRDRRGILRDRRGVVRGRRRVVGGRRRVVRGGGRGIRRRVPARRLLRLRLEQTLHEIRLEAAHVEAALLELHGQIRDAKPLELREVGHLAGRHRAWARVRCPARANEWRANSRERRFHQVEGPSDGSSRAHPSAG